MNISYLQCLTSVFIFCLEMLDVFFNSFQCFYSFILFSFFFLQIVSDFPHTSWSDPPPEHDSPPSVLHAYSTEFRSQFLPNMSSVLVHFLSFSGKPLCVSVLYTFHEVEHVVSSDSAVEGGCCTSVILQLFWRLYIICLRYLLQLSLGCGSMG